MNILITNDDGIRSPALHALAEWASGFGSVTVVAPLVEQSGKSQGINIRGSIRLTGDDTFGEKIRAYAVDSTPADCIRVALDVLRCSPDLVLSGINRGFNVGNDIAYSGTLGAATEAVTFGFPAVAISSDTNTPDYAIASLDRVKAFFDKHRLLERHNFYNINVPDEPGKIRITGQGGLFYTDTFRQTGDGSWKAHICDSYEPDLAPDLDTDAVMNGFISVTPMTAVRTCLLVLEETKNLTEG